VRRWSGSRLQLKWTLARNAASRDNALVAYDCTSRNASQSPERLQPWFRHIAALRPQAVISPEWHHFSLREKAVSAAERGARAAIASNADRRSAHAYHGRAGMGINRQRQRGSRGGSQTRSCTVFIFALGLTAGAVTITGCASTVADHTPTAMGGLPEGAPARPSSPPAYPAVNDVPPPRSSAVLSSAEQKKLEDELAEARKRAAAAAGTAKPSAGTASQ
jgi:hypothetical protein